MRLVVADTGPINYLVLIDSIDLLPSLFEQVVLPSAVQAELADADAPPSVRAWIANPPDWLDVYETPGSRHDSVRGLDEGEAAAIALAASLRADLVLMDERKGVAVARAQGLRVTGTLGVLDMAAQRGLIDFGQAVERLRQTSFRIPEALLDSMLKKHAGNGSDAWGRSERE